jgi:hypothetical protein
VQNATCSRCKRSLPAAAFKPDPKLRRGLDSWCRSCHNEATAKWRESNPDQVEAYNVGRRKVVEMARCGHCDGLYAQNRTDKLYCSKRCRDRARDARRPEEYRQRRAVRLQERYAESRAFRLHLLGDPCAYCGKASACLDHIVARATGTEEKGEHAWPNLTAACNACNAAKRTKSLLGHLLVVQTRREHRAALEFANR